MVIKYEQQITINYFWLLNIMNDLYNHTRCIDHDIKESNKCINIDLDELRLAPFKANDPDDPDNENGLITSIWGHHEWESLGSKAFGYPIKPTEQQKIDYLNHFISEGNVLPCKYCRESYKQFIKDGDTVLDMSVMESRETLTKWLFRLHNAINRKLEVDYGKTYEEMCYKFNSYRAKCTKTEKGCITPLSIKAKSYQKADIHRAPIIDKKYSIALIGYAKKLGLEKYEEFLNYYSSLIRNSNGWSARDCTARKIIKYMRKNGISSLTEEKMPSIHEMTLISMLSTTLERSMLDAILDRLNNK